jgi:hypothetical protein
LFISSSKFAGIKSAGKKKQEQQSFLRSRMALSVAVPRLIGNGGARRSARLSVGETAERGGDDGDHADYNRFAHFILQVCNAAAEPIASNVNSSWLAPWGRSRFP